MKFHITYILASVAAVYAVDEEVPPPECHGELEYTVIDFEEDHVGKAFSKGSVPTRLPTGLRVAGRRPNWAKVPPTANDLLILDARNPGADDKDLRFPDEKMVMIISEDGDTSEPNDNRKGGTIFFRWSEPVFHVKSMTLLDIEKKNKAFIDGKDAENKKLRRIKFPAEGNRKASTVELDWYEVKRMKLRIKTSAAVAKLEVGICKGEDFPVDCVVRK